MSTIPDISSWISGMNFFLLNVLFFNIGIGIEVFFYFLVECCYKGWEASTISYCYIMFSLLCVPVYSFLHFFASR